MNEKILNHVKAYWESKGYGTPDEDTCVEIIREAKQLWKGNEDSRRWWTDITRVVEVNGMVIGFKDAETTGDDSPRDKGFEFDPSTICEYKPVEKTITVYEKVE